MTNPDPAAGRTAPPWTAAGTVYFWRGPLSNFAPTPGLRLPVGYHGHHEREHVAVPTVEHWFQACKATSREQFDRILACSTAAASKRAGRATELRPDWEQVKFDVMLRALRGKFALEPYRSALLLTGERPLAEASPHDFVWGCRDPADTFTGRNLLGLALMQVRDEIVDGVERDLRRVAEQPSRPAPPCTASIEEWSDPREDRGERA
jgi:N-glycosidase YbiA